MAAVGVLGVAVLAFGADRFVLGTSISSPGTAGAAEVPLAAPVAQAEVAPTAESPKSAVKVEVESVASRLLADGVLPATDDAKASSADDAFVVPAGWLPKVVVESAPDIKPDSNVPEAVTNFKATITAILGTQAAPVVQVALEGGARKALILGQKVGGLELLRVNVAERTAVFGLNGFEKPLTLGTRNE